MAILAIFWPIFYDFIFRCSTSQNRNIKDNHLWIEDISWSEFGLFFNQRALSVWRTWWTEYLRDWTFCERWCWQDSDFVTRTRRWYTIYIYIYISCPPPDHYLCKARIPFEMFLSYLFFISLFLYSSLSEKFSVIVKQKDRFGVIFLLLWLSEHTQGGGGLCPGVSRHEHIFCVIKN